MPMKRPGQPLHPGTPEPDAVDDRSRDPESSDRAFATAEVASAALVIQALVKAERGFSIYLPNNPLHEKFFDDFCHHLDEHLEEFGDLRLDLEFDSIRCRGEVIYTHQDRRENLAFRMHADGIRALIVAERIEGRELRALVEALQQSPAEAGEDDIVTKLWSGDLPHVTYLLAEVPVTNGTPLLPQIGTRAAHEGAIRRFAAELAAAPAAPPQQLHSQQIFSLDEQDLATLQALLDAEQRRTPLEDVAGILEAVLGAETEPAVLEEFLEIASRLCGDLLITGRVDSAVKLIEVFVRVGARPGLPPESAAAIEAARARIITGDVLIGLSRQLAVADAVPRDDLKALVTALGSAAVEPFCHILGDVVVQETRKVLVETLAETGRDSPDRFLSFLADPRWYLVRNTIYILRRIASPEAARAVRRCAGHADRRVRKEVLLYLEETADPEAEPILLAFLADKTAALRVAAARSLARRGSRLAAEHLFALTGTADFAARDLAEREAVWESLGELAPARAFPELQRMLLKRSWFGQGRELDETACAVAGLRRIGTPAAVELLQQAVAVKRGGARDLVVKALRTLAQAPAAGGAKHKRKGDGAADRG